MSPYLKFWQIDRPLFTRIEPVSAIYLPDRLLAPLERLALTCGQDAALVLITGEVGTGKTTLLRWLAQRLPPLDYDIMMTTMIQRETRSHWLLPRLAEHMGVAHQTTTSPNHLPIRSIVSRLDEYLEASRKLVLMIDAAQLIAGETGFDEIAALFSLQSVSGGCVVCVLCGSEQLSQNLQKAPELTARTAYELRLPSLSPSEAAAYLACRIQSAGAHISFDQDALDILYSASRGIIASLNLHAEGCLIAAYQAGSHKISAALARAAISFRESLVLQAVSATSSAPVPSTNSQSSEHANNFPKQKAVDTADLSPNQSINLTSLFKR